MQVQSSPLLRLGIIVAMTLASAAWLVHKGPVPVVRITTPLSEMAPFWYMVLAFPVLGMLVADLVDLYRSRGVDRLSVELAVQIALIVAVSNLRLGVRLPISGHACWWPTSSAGAGGCGRTLRGRMRSSSRRLSIFALIAYPKLIWWDDPVTLCIGLAAGLLLAAISQRITASHRRTEPR